MLPRPALRCLIHLLGLLLLQVSAAVDLLAPEVVTVDPGQFLSIPVSAAAGNAIAVDVPAWLRLTSQPQLRDGRALVNFLVERDAPAGETTITLHLHENGRPIASQAVRIRITPRAGFELISSEGQEVISGERATYTIVITNTGNSRDLFHIRASSSLPVRLDHTTVELAPGEQAYVEMILDTQDRQHDVTIVRAHSELDPNLSQYRVITTTILPFAGAGAIEGPALAWELQAAAALGNDGFDYALGARLSGDLSEFVRLSSDLNYRNNMLAGSAALEGAGWGVAYRGFAQLQNLEAHYGRVRGFLAVPLGSPGFSAGLSYTHDPLSVSFTHRGGTSSSDAFRVTYAFDAGSYLKLLPSIGLQGYRTSGEDYRVGALFGLGARLQTSALNATADFRFTLPQEPLAPWSVSLTASNRVQGKLGLSGDLNVNNRHFTAGITAREAVNREISLNQSVRYAVVYGNPAMFTARAGISYRPEGARLLLSGSLSGRWRAEEASFGYTLGAAYRPGNWEFEASMETLGDMRVNVGAGYDFGSFNVRSTYSHGPAGRPLLLGAGGSSGNFRASFLAGYDFQQQAAAVELDASYQFTSNFATFISLAHAEDEFSVRAGASVRFRGGFATPESVVNIFGGRQVGWIEGVLFHDLNANGQPDAGEQRLVGVTVSAGNTSAETGSEGRFRLALPAGEHRITISNISAGLALTTPAEVSVSVNETNIVDLPLRAVTGLTGTVIKTAGPTADPQAGTPLPYSRITLEREDGQLFTTRADDRGRFFFQNLEPGHYTIMLDPASLPEFHMVTSPPQELDLQPGPLRRIDLTAAEQEKTVIPTFLPGDLALTARTEPASAPAGADIRVIALVQGEAQKVFVRFAGSEVPLELQEPGQYAAMITLPSEPGVANLEVIASDSRKEVQRSLTLVLQPGSLGRLQVQPPYLEAGEEAGLTAEFLTRVEEVFVLFDGERVSLTREGPYTFSGQLQAPAEPGSYQLELEADGEIFSTARFRVAD